MTIQKNTKWNKIIIKNSHENGGEEVAVMSEQLFADLRIHLFGGKLFDLICALQQLAWKDDDMMDQDTLFEMQEKLSEFVLQFAERLSPEYVDRIVKQFPWMYKAEEE